MLAQESITEVHALKRRRSSGVLPADDWYRPQVSQTARFAGSLKMPSAYCSSLT